MKRGMELAQNCPLFLEMHFIDKKMRRKRLTITDLFCFLVTLHVRTQRAGSQGGRGLTTESWQGDVDWPFAWDGSEDADSN
jgi:hypothetical protein